jgi:ribosomal protein S18 acetylase RimI-like enzyme
MEIVELNQLQKQELEVFKSQVWPDADREHYGEDHPSFSKKVITYIAQENHEIIGYVSLMIDTGVAQIEPLMVKKELRGRGIGTKLLGRVEEEARNCGVHKLWLETGNHWQAKSFYEKHGYYTRALLPNHIHGQEFVLMDKML